MTSPARAGKTYTLYTCAVTGTHSQSEKRSKVGRLFNSHHMQSEAISSTPSLIPPSQTLYRV